MIKAKDDINIVISRAQHARLQKLGNIGDTMKDVIEKLLLTYEARHKKPNQ